MKEPVPTSNANCYLCKEEIPPGQSYYEDHDRRVCLKCFQSTPRCRRCKFPSNSLKLAEDHGMICEFCQSLLMEETGEACHLCGKKILSGMSHYADHEVVVCQTCFKDAKIRCYFCRFPSHQELVLGVGGACEFCVDGLIGNKTDVDAVLKPLKTFLQQYRHPIDQLPAIRWVAPEILIGMQLAEPPPAPIRFFDEFVQFANPVFHDATTLYSIGKLPQPWFMSVVVGQLASFEICQRFQLKNLLGETPFHKMARGWTHFLAYTTAKLLRYETVMKKLSRRPEGELVGDFPRFLAMTEYRKPKEILEIAHQNLNDFAQRYLQ